MLHRRTSYPSSSMVFVFMTYKLQSRCQHRIEANPSKLPPWRHTLATGTESSPDPAGIGHKNAEIWCCHVTSTWDTHTYTLTHSLSYSQVCSFWAGLAHASRKCTAPQTEISCFRIEHGCMCKSMCMSMCMCMYVYMYIYTWARCIWTHAHVCISRYVLCI